MTPLHQAADFGRKEVAELLIANGADVNTEDNDGYSPLHYAAMNGLEEIAKLLITKGANVNAKDGKGRTPLDMLSSEELVGETAETAIFLRKHGGKTAEELKAKGN